jgi:hypothetical protein
MTKEEIIDMAKQVKMPYFFTDESIVNIVKLEAFAKLVAQHERENLLEVGCAECGVNSNNHALYCVACSERYLKEKNT